MTVHEPGIKGVLIERERLPDGRIDGAYKYFTLHIVGESGGHIVIARVSLADLREIAENIREFVKS